MLRPPDPRPSARRRHAAALLALCAAAAGCTAGGGGLPPPPFDGKPARLFYPGALAVSPDGRSVLVASTNFDRAFDFGTLLQIDLAAFDDAAAAGGSLRVEDLGAKLLGSGLLGSFAGTMTAVSPSDPARQAVYVTVQDNDTLARAPLPDGKLACARVEHDGLTAPDCSADAVDLAAASMQDPFAVRPLLFQFDGAAQPELALAVTHLSPVALAEGGNTTTLDSRLALIPERLAAASAAPFANGALSLDIGAAASNSLAVAPLTNQLFVGGCLERFNAETVVECGRNPGSSVQRALPLRWVYTDAGSRTPVWDASGKTLFNGGDTRDLAVSSDGTLLYLAVAQPDALVVAELPLPGAGTALRPRAVVALGSAPSRLRVLPRAGGDLVAITQLSTDSMVLVDAAAGRVVSQLRPVGKQPYAIDSVRGTAGDRLFIALFNECAVAEVDVADSPPAVLRPVAKVGGCP